MSQADDPRVPEAAAILRRAIMQGCRPVWDGSRLADLVGPNLAIMEFAEGMRRLFPEVTPIAELAAAPAPVPPPPSPRPDPAAAALRAGAKAHRRQIEAWRRGQRKVH